MTTRSNADGNQSMKIIITKIAVNGYILPVRIERQINVGDSIDVIDLVRENLRIDLTGVTIPFEWALEWCECVEEQM